MKNNLSFSKNKCTKRGCIYYKKTKAIAMSDCILYMFSARSDCIDKDFKRYTPKQYIRLWNWSIRKIRIIFQANEKSLW